MQFHDVAQQLSYWSLASSELKTQRHLETSVCVPEKDRCGVQFIRVGSLILMGSILSLSHHIYLSFPTASRADLWPCARLRYNRLTDTNCLMSSHNHERSNLSLRSTGSLLVVLHLWVNPINVLAMLDPPIYQY